MIFESPISMHDQLAKRCMEENIPLGAIIELTSQCNLKCRHCYMVSDGSTELSTGEIKDIINQLADIGTIYLGFTGGEIFSREDLFTLLKYARKKGFVISLLTNGTLITPEMIEEIKKLKPLFFEISLYGVTPDVHDNVTQVKGSFEKTMKVIETMHDQGINVKVKTPVMNLNVRESEDLSKLCKRLGLKHLMDPGILPARDGSRNPVLYDLSDEELRIYATKHDLNLGYLQEMGTTRRFICLAGKALCGITSGGTVFPCIILPIPVGNLREKSFKEIWNINPSHELARLRSMTIQDLQSCSVCDIKNYCIRCPGLVYLETEDIVGSTKSICRFAGVRKDIQNQHVVMAV